jgi:type IV pilus assembly protein PilE
MLLSDSFLARPRERGFTLIELLVTVAIVAMLASLAYPSFMGAIRKSRRSEAVEMMTKIQQAQERWRANKPAYTDNLSAPPAGLGVSTVATVATTAHGYYEVTVDVPTDATAGSTYTITAKASGSQAADSNCASMTVKMEAGKIKYDSTSGDRCWAK